MHICFTIIRKEIIDALFIACKCVSQTKKLQHLSKDFIVMYNDYQSMLDLYSSLCVLIYLYICANMSQIPTPIHNNNL